MTIEEIKQAIANGEQVKFHNSKNIVKISCKGFVYSENLTTGSRDELSQDDLDDCFV